jgi:hypothetical protein
MIFVATTCFFIPSLGSESIKITPPKVCRLGEVHLEMKEYDTKNVMKNNRVNNNEKPKYAIIKHICPFLTARDLNHCIAVSKKFNTWITTYLEMYTPYFGLIDFTKQLKKYRPEIEQISDQEKIITIQNPNPNEETEIMFDLNRENFYFPFTLEFSQIPILLNINEKCIHVHPKELLNNKDFKKMTFSPRTNTIFFHSPESVDFNYVSIIKFKLRPFQEIENSVGWYKRFS